MSESNVLENAVKLIGEAVFLPGTSEFLAGNIPSGALHATAGYLASMLIGPLGFLLVGANSYSHAVTGQHLHNQIQNAFRGAPEAPAENA